MPTKLFTGREFLSLSHMSIRFILGDVHFIMSWTVNTQILKFCCLKIWVLFFFLKCIILVSFLWILSLFLFFWREPFSNQLFHPGNYWTKVTVEAIKLCIDQSSPFDACNCTRTCQSDAGKKIACAISVYDTHCLGYWNKENERKNENIQFIVDDFSLTCVNLLLAWNCTSMYDFRIRENFKLGVNTIIGLAYINLFVLEPANS